MTYNFRLCALYLLESNFIDDAPKFFAGTLSAMSSMINLDCSHINVMSKMDLVKSGDTGERTSGGRNHREMQRSVYEKSGHRSSTYLTCAFARYLDPDPLLLAEEANASTNPKFHALNQAIVQLVRSCVPSTQGPSAEPSFFSQCLKIDDFAMVSFMPLDSTDEESVGALLSHVDNAMQYGEDEVSGSIAKQRISADFSSRSWYRNQKSQRIWTWETLERIEGWTPRVRLLVSRSNTYNSFTVVSPDVN